MSKAFAKQEAAVASIVVCRNQRGFVIAPTKLQRHFWPDRPHLLHHRANKRRALDYAQERFGRHKVKNDHEADALLLAHYFFSSTTTK
jgi:pyridoxine/pyridoxamine 5'-phosphate oxidase